MRREVDHAQLVGRHADARLLDADLTALPDALERPEEPGAAPARGAIVATGATLTGVSLLAGLALVVLGIVEVISHGVGAGAIAALAVGAALLATHWGWVHVAEAGAQALDARHNRDLLARRDAWLAGIEPYARWSVSTTANDDGSITIVRARHLPVPAGERTFTFVREEQASEVHGGDEPAATVAERAELLRRQAAAATSAERSRYEAAHGAHQRALLAHADETERVAAVRAASQALSDQINANLSDPPLTE